MYLQANRFLNKTYWKGKEKGEERGKKKGEERRGVGREERRKEAGKERKKEKNVSQLVQIGPIVKHFQRS